LNGIVKWNRIVKVLVLSATFPWFHAVDFLLKLCLSLFCKYIFLAWVE